MLTVEQVRVEVEKIRYVSHDDENAHSMEDDLHQYVLRAIAAGNCEDPAVCAAEALKTEEIKFQRWCA